MLVRFSTRPAPFGNTRPSSPFGQASLHSRNALTTIGGNGTVRSPASDLSGPDRV